MANLTVTLTELEAAHLVIAANLDARTSAPHTEAYQHLHSAIAKLQPAPAKRVFIAMEALGSVYALAHGTLCIAPLCTDGTFSRYIEDYHEVDQTYSTPEDQRLHGLVRVALSTIGGLAAEMDARRTEALAEEAKRNG